MVNIYDINANAEEKDFIENLKHNFTKEFSKVEDADIYIINNFPSVTDDFGVINYLIFINIPYRKGNYYSYKDGDKWYYLNSLVIAIKKIVDDNIIDVNDSCFLSNDGEFDYKSNLENESLNFNSFVYNLLNIHFNCTFINWIKANSNCSVKENNYLIINKGLALNNLIRSACRRTIPKGKIGTSCLPDDVNLPQIINRLIEEANKNTRLGILTKDKVNKITKSTKTTERICQLQGEKLCLITGKAGSGKTLALARAFYEIAQNNHARLLTFNNLLAIDIKQSVRNIGRFNNNNASIWTLHKFFYRLSKKMRVLALLTFDRVQELLNICSERVLIANNLLKEYESKHGKFPVSLDIFHDEYNDKIEKSDKIEVLKYAKYFISQSTGDVTFLKEQYIDNYRRYLELHLGNNIFLEDYSKVLETMYLMIDNPREFFEKYDIKSRYDYLIQIDKTDKVTAKEKEYTYEDFSKFIKKNTKSLTWSNSIIIDEAQDCNIYEKLIIMKLRGTENLIISSGGKDQLIRSSKEIDWRVMLGKPVSFEEVKLGNKCYRQKANIVDFINQFTEHFELTEKMQSIAESKGVGQVILDMRMLDTTLPMDIIQDLKNKGEVYGCSAYENLMFLLPSIGYTTGKEKKDLQIDSNDNIEFVKASAGRQLQIEDKELDIWNGIVENKSNLKVPGQNQTRFIYYDSCRGLEAWSVLCIDIDTFFYKKRGSQEAEKYAIEQNSLFIEKDNLKTRYALLWCLMAFTRPIDTLYLKIKSPTCEFAQQLLKIANECGGAIKILT